MSEMLRVDVNSRPWAPAADARVVVEFHRHDVPLAGVIEQDGRRFLFSCLVGEMEDHGIWAYAPISDETEQRISALTGRAVDDAIKAAFRDSMTVFAGVIGLRVEFADLIDIGQESPMVGIDRFLARWKKRIDRQNAAVGEMAATTDLVSA